MIRISLCFFFTSVFLGLSAPAHGSADSMAHAMPHLDTMRVTTSPFSSLMNATESYSTIRASQWEGKGMNLADIIVQESGIQTRRFGGMGSFQTVSIRGIPGSKVLVYLDGIPLNSAGGGAVDLSKISPSRLDKIDIYKGIVPAGLGGNNIGGVIHLQSKKGTGKPFGSVSLLSGSYNTHSLAASTSL